MPKQINTPYKDLIISTSLDRIQCSFEIFRIALCVYFILASSYSQRQNSY